MRAQLQRFFNRFSHDSVSNQGTIQKENSSSILPKAQSSDWHGFNTKRACLFLFVVALVVRLLILVTFDNNYISPDGMVYHTLAANVAKGNGLSLQGYEPFERSFLREPGYPMFLGGIYSVVKLFHPVRYIQGLNRTTYILDDTYPEIITAKVVQSIIGATSIVLVFLILIRISNFRMAFWTGLISAVFVQLAFQNMFILRETLVMFLLLVLNWLYLEYLSEKRKILYLTFMGIVVGFLILVFQIHIVILPVFFVLTWIISRRWWLSLKHTTLISAVTVLIIAPHCLSAYSYYPNINVLKSFGTSLTHEMMAYTRAQFITVDYGLQKREDAYISLGGEWGRSSREQFDRSFNGYYLAKADSLNSLIPTAWLIKHKISTYAFNAIHSIYMSGVGYLSGAQFIAKYGWLIGYQLLLLPRVIGIFGFLGLIAFGRKYLLYLLPFVTYALFFWILGSEYRRMIILQPFFIFFGVLFGQYIYLKAKGYLQLTFPTPEK
ncbi:MAG: hypothetical protein GQ565_07240 [Candidatus Aegiribacteria sp.]|nr:hypothetical protein [Candidatus Aegiribacteria sp.]